MTHNIRVELRDLENLQFPKVDVYIQYNTFVRITEIQKYRNTEIQNKKHPFCVIFGWPKSNIVMSLAKICL